MKAWFLLALLATRAVAADDAPLTALAVEAPGTLCYSVAQREKLAAHIVAVETERGELREAVKGAPSVWTVVALSIIAFGIGGAVGYGVATAKK